LYGFSGNDSIYGGSEAAPCRSLNGLSGRNQGPRKLSSGESNSTLSLPEGAALAMVGFQSQSIPTNQYLTLKPHPLSQLEDDCHPVSEPLTLAGIWKQAQTEN
jgi:hypothetical protein